MTFLTSSAFPTVGKGIARLLRASTRGQQLIDQTSSYDTHIECHSAESAMALVWKQFKSRARVAEEVSSPTASS